MNPRLLLRLALRIVGLRRREVSGDHRLVGGRTAVVAVVGVAVGVAALIVVLAVMNGFQLGFIERILAVDSYHLQLQPPPGAVATTEAIAASTPRVTAAFPFVDITALASAAGQRRRGIRIRALPEDIGLRDRELVELLGAGGLPTLPPGGVHLGAELAFYLGVRVGDSISVTVLDPRAGGARVQRVDLSVSGLFRSGYYDFDLNWAMVSLETAAQLAPADQTLVGVKLDNRFGDAAVAASLENRFREAGLEAVGVESWRSYNASFFGALRTEKLMMSLLLALVFLVVAVNIRHLLTRAVMERRGSIAVLCALGASTRGVRASFVSAGAMIGVAGAAGGALVGLAIAVNIDAVFRGIEVGADLLFLLAEGVMRAAGADVTLPAVRIFSPADFYLDAVPSRILPGETVAIGVVAIGSATVAAARASRHVSAVDPAAMLRDEP